MAGNEVARLYLSKLRSYLTTNIHNVTTPAGEPASLWWIYWTLDVPLKYDPLVFFVLLGIRNRDR
jgi:hypothetical protein